MKTSSDILYSKRFYDLSKTCVIDGSVIKNRGENIKSLDTNEILERISKFDNIVIQEDRIIKIYCNKEQKMFYDYEINNNQYLKNSFESGRINVYVK